MEFYHVTAIKNRASIAQEGLCPSYATGKLRAVWLVSKAKVRWAILHTLARHKIELGGIWVLRVVLPKGLARKFNMPGRFWCPEVIPVEAITDTYDAYDWENGQMTREEQAAYDELADQVTGARG